MDLEYYSYKVDSDPMGNTPDYAYRLHSATPAVILHPQLQSVTIIIVIIIFIF